MVISGRWSPSRCRSMGLLTGGDRSGTIGRRLVRGLVRGLGQQLSLPIFGIVGSMEEGDGCAVVVSRYGKDVNEAASRTKGVGVGGHEEEPEGERGIAATAVLSAAAGGPSSVVDLRSASAGSDAVDASAGS